MPFDLFIPDSTIPPSPSPNIAMAPTLEKAIPSPTSLILPKAVAEKVTHLGIGAHQDDLEIMALPGILQCYQNPKQHFAGIICTDGSNSPRRGIYASHTQDEMKYVRAQEQRQAAVLGEYLFVAQLDFPSSLIKSPDHAQLIETLYQLFSQLSPCIIYTHHPLDKHPTHRAVCHAVIEALRRLPSTQHPKQLLGGEVWRSLDWVIDEDKIALDTSMRSELAQDLLCLFDSQISGGKRYDLAAQGRRYANATFGASHHTDQATEVLYAIDLLPLVKNPSLTLSEFALGFVERFHQKVKKEQSCL